MIKQYHCWIFLFLWKLCVILNESKEFQSREVDICPRDQSSWDTASRDLNCTPPDRYQCTPNENLTELLEFCYDQPPTFVVKGYCWILSDSFTTDTYNCIRFTEGCPNITYRSNQLYKYQQCLQINKLEGCYLSEPKCPNQSYIFGELTTENQSSLPLSTVLLRSTTPQSSTIQSFTIKTSTTEIQPTYDKTSPNIIVSAVTFVIFFIVLIAVILFVKRLRDSKPRERSKDEEDSYHFEAIPVPNMESVGENIELQCLRPMDEERPTLTIREIKREGPYMVIEYEVSASEECKPLTSLSWKRNGFDLILPDNSGKYSGGTLNDSSLRIRGYSEECSGKYEGKVQNTFGENTILCNLDAIQCSSKECQSFLLCCLLFDKYRVFERKSDEWEKKLTLCWKFCDGDIKQNITENVQTSIKCGKFENHIFCENNAFELRSPINVFESFAQRRGFVDFFLDHSCSQSINIFCRSPGYRKKKGETCCKVGPEQFRIIVQRLKFDIFGNSSIKDKTCHQIIEEVLNIPKGILCLGSEGISKYLKDLKDDQHVVYVARGMLVGCEGAGKTSLLCRLNGEDKPNPPPTRGIDVHLNEFIVDGNNLTATSSQNKSFIRSNFGVRSQEGPPNHQNIEDTVHNTYEMYSVGIDDIGEDQSSSKVLPGSSEMNDIQVAAVADNNEDSTQNVYRIEKDVDKKISFMQTL